MDTNGDLNGTSNRTVTRSESSVSGTPRFITRIMPQKSFDLVCMVLAEILGTSTLLLMGCAGTVPWNGPPISIQPPLNFGLTVAMIVQMFGHVSYALLNPAVSIAAVVYNLITIKEAVLLSVAQCIGAILGYGLLKFFVPEDIFANGGEYGVCVTVLHPGVSVAKGFFIEFILTSVLITVICGMWDPRNHNNSDSTPLRIGFAVAAISIAGGPFTDASMNPARTLGPAAWNWRWENQWLYWVAPLSAGLFASLFYKFVFWRQHPNDQKLPETLPLSLTPKTEL